MLNNLRRFPNSRNADLMAALMALLFSATGLPLAEVSSANANELTPSPITIGETHMLPGPQFGKAEGIATREINIWLPPDYAESDATYDVLYLIDGGLKQDFQHIAGLTHLGALSWQYKPLILVGIQTIDRQAELTPKPADERYIKEFPTAGHTDDFRAFIVETVMPFVEENYRTGERRAIIGESLAGLFIVDTFLRAPDAFDDYIAVSPSLWWDDQAPTRAASETLQDRDDKDKRLFLAMADEGGTMQAGLDKLIKALEGRDSKEFDWRYEDYSTRETHATIFHPAALTALRWLYAYPPYDYGPAPWYLIEGGVPKPEANSTTKN